MGKGWVGASEGVAVAGAAVGSGAAADGGPFGGLAAPAVISFTSFSMLISPAPSSEGEAGAGAWAEMSIPSVASGAATAGLAEEGRPGGRDAGDGDADALDWEGVLWWPSSSEESSDEASVAPLVGCGTAEGGRDEGTGAEADGEPLFKESSGADELFMDSEAIDTSASSDWGGRAASPWCSCSCSSPGGESNVFA